MPLGLLVSHTGRSCGVYQFGIRLFNVLRLGAVANLSALDWIYYECNSLENYKQLSTLLRPDVTLFNFHPLTLPWAAKGGWGRESGTTFGVFHEVYQDIADTGSAYPFDFMLCPDPTLLPRNPAMIAVPRFMPIWNEFKVAPPERFTIGSFGYATKNKGFASLCALVSQQFDAAHIRLNLTPHDKSSIVSPEAALDIELSCRSELKPGISLDITKEFMDEDCLMRFLASNTLNVFLYENEHGRGLSSCTDYALACDRPVAVNYSPMFRHLHEVNPSICVEDCRLALIAANGVAHLKYHKERYSASNSGATWNKAILLATELRTASLAVPDQKGFCKFFDKNSAAKYAKQAPGEDRLLNGLSYILDDVETQELFLLDTVRRLSPQFEDLRILVVVADGTKPKNPLEAFGYKVDYLKLRKKPAPVKAKLNVRITGLYDIVMLMPILVNHSLDSGMLRNVADFVAPEGLCFMFASIVSPHNYLSVGSDDGGQYRYWDFFDVIMETLPDFGLADKNLLINIFSDEVIRNSDSENNHVMSSLVVRRHDRRQLQRHLGKTKKKLRYDHSFIAKYSSLLKTLHSFGRPLSNMSTQFSSAVHDNGDKIFHSDGSQIGYLIFGPYISLQAGRYMCTFLARIKEPAFVDFVFGAFDIVAEGIVLGFEQQISTSDLAPSGYSSLSFNFELTTSVNAFEARLFLRHPIAISVLATAALLPLLPFNT